MQAKPSVGDLFESGTVALTFSTGGIYFLASAPPTVGGVLYGLGGLALLRTPIKQATTLLRDYFDSRR